MANTESRTFKEKNKFALDADNNVAVRAIIVSGDGNGASKIQSLSKSEYDKFNVVDITDEQVIKIVIS